MLSRKVFFVVFPVETAQVLRLTTPKTIPLRTSFFDEYDCTGRIDCADENFCSDERTLAAIGNQGEGFSVRHPQRMKPAEQHIGLP